MTINVLAVASEAYPLIKTGGLADVVGALPAALRPHDVHVTTMLPAYPAVQDKLDNIVVIHSYDDLFGGPARLLSAKARGLDVIALDAPNLFNRVGGPYAAPDGTEWPDNAYRFAALGKAAADVGAGLTSHPKPHIVHIHDWQAGLAPAYLAFGPQPRPRTVATIHNIAFQGWFPASLADVLGLPPVAMTIEGVEYFSGVGYLKSAVWFSDKITTVSPTYAGEILEPDGGLGLDGLLSGRAADVLGILNGVDVEDWNPATDRALPKNFSASDRADRPENKAALGRQFGLSMAGDPLTFGVVSRLSSQKGLDLLAESISALLDLGANLALLGAGEPWLEHRFRELASAHPGRIGCRFGYDEGLARLIQAGCDALLVPSRFEPCGLTQLCALRYGAIPVVARVGGLADTIIDANPMALAAGVATGVQFSPVGQPQLEAALRRTAALYAARPVWKKLQANGMATDVSWNASAKAYAALYRDLLAG